MLVVLISWLLVLAPSTLQAPTGPAKGHFAGYAGLNATYCGGGRNELVLGTHKPNDVLFRRFVYSDLCFTDGTNYCNETSPVLASIPQASHDGLMRFNFSTGRPIWATFIKRRWQNSPTWAMDRDKTVLYYRDAAAANVEFYTLGNAGTPALTIDPGEFHQETAETYWYDYAGMFVVKLDIETGGVEWAANCASGPYSYPDEYSYLLGGDGRYEDGYERVAVGDDGSVFSSVVLSVYMPDLDPGVKCFNADGTLAEEFTFTGKNKTVDNMYLSYQASMFVAKYDKDGVYLWSSLSATSGSADYVNMQIYDMEYADGAVFFSGVLQSQTAKDFEWGFQSANPIVMPTSFASVPGFIVKIDAASGQVDFVLKLQVGVSFQSIMRGDIAATSTEIFFLAYPFTLYSSNDNFQAGTDLSPYPPGSAQSLVALNSTTGAVKWRNIISYEFLSPQILVDRAGNPVLIGRARGYSSVHKIFFSNDTLIASKYIGFTTIGYPFRSATKFDRATGDPIWYALFTSPPYASSTQVILDPDNDDILHIQTDLYDDDPAVDVAVYAGSLTNAAGTDFELIGRIPRPVSLQKRATVFYTINMGTLLEHGNGGRMPPVL